MSSINDRETVDKIIASNGKGRPPVIEILEYRNIFNGGITYKLIYKGDDVSYIKTSLVCLSQKSIWRRS